MTQEELNELILGNFNEADIEPKAEEKDANDSGDLPEQKDLNPLAGEISVNEGNLDPNHYRVSADEQWPPPPPITDHKVVEQLDDVTKGLEVKATQVFDQLEMISNNTDSVIKDAKKIKDFVVAQKELFKKLSTQFPKIETFKASLESCNDTIKQINTITDKSNESADAVLQAMDIMQYQDIHRQKIERVVNIMRTLAKYLNAMFDADIDDSKRVGSATYIEGDKKDDLADSAEIEKLIADLGKK